MIVDCTEPDEQPVPLEYFQNLHVNVQDTAELLVLVYRDVWNEFYAWEQDHCATIIASHPRHPADDRDYLRLQTSPSNVAVGDNPDCLYFSLSEFDGTGVENTSSYIPCPKIPFASSVPPHPPYQFCTPVDRSVFWRMGDVNDPSCVPFLPYADEQKFDAIKYLKSFVASTEYPKLEWEVMIDPDREMIQLETIRRLHFAHNLSFDEIDAVGEEIFGDRTRCNNESGIIWSCSQRDPLKWSGSSLAPFPELPPFRVPEQWDIKARLSSVMRTFCPNLNCVHPHCSVHVTEQADMDLPVSRRLNSSFRLDGGLPCERLCFRHEYDGFVDKDHYDKTSESIISMFPDISPCDLAILCNKPCREIFALRCHLFPDRLVQQGERERQNAPPKDFFKDTQRHNEFTPLMQPCHHKGLCKEDSSCPCYKGQLHCQRNCRCEDDCVLRWKGCRCKVDPKTRTSGYVPCGPRCPCRLAYKECDPELCLSCEARHAIARIDRRKRCSNVAIQRGLTPLLEVKRGRIGLGAFSTTPIAQDEYLGDYVGEAYDEVLPPPEEDEDEDDDEIQEPTGDPKDLIRKHTGLNYLFTANSGQVLDAVTVGNETRYFNHKNVPNVDIQIKLVNNEHRIAFFSTKKIQKGRELFINYGDLYWQDTKPVDF